MVEETGSTNADLLARAATLPGPLLLVARNQTAGRGRAGRSWLSSSEGSLTFSLAWKFDGGLPRLTGLPLAVGVALADTLERLGVQVGLKWPNDVLRDGDKLAGILIETQAAQGGGVWAVIGIGLNLLMPDELEARIGRSVASLPWLARMDRDALLAALLDGLADALARIRPRRLCRLCRALEPAPRLAGRDRHDPRRRARCCTKAAPPAWTTPAACCSIRPPDASPCSPATCRCA